MLTSGTYLGPYRVVSKLGEGGMGEVYRAYDSTLHRDVAIKILPDARSLKALHQRHFLRDATGGIVPTEVSRVRPRKRFWKLCHVKSRTTEKHGEYGFTHR